MRVCLVSAEYAPLVGGLADYTRLLAGHLAQQGAEVRVLATTDCHGEPTDAFQVEGSVPRWNFGVFRALRQMIDGFRPDVVHLQFQTAAYGMHPGVMLAPTWMQFRHPALHCVTTFHDLREPYLFPKAHPVRRWLLRRMAADSAQCVATNNGDARALAAAGANVTVVPIGSNVPLSEEPPYQRRELQARWGAPAEGALVGFFGLLNQAKGFDTLLQALAALRASGRPVALLVMGDRLGASDPTNRAYAARVEALAVELGVADSVHWTGYLPEVDLSRALRSVDLCALPFTGGASYRNGTLLAALSNGVPLVTIRPIEASVAGALAPLVDGREALLAEPGDAASLAAAITRLLDDPALRASLAEAGLARSRQFAWTDIAAQHLALYRSLAGAEIRHPA
ncbi:MAG: glycosyltransferase [Dehalococcoidia bacterium]|nr:glycosyltransferase [Dehalococcoidia bacterium]